MAKIVLISRYIQDEPYQKRKDVHIFSDYFLGVHFIASQSIHRITDQCGVGLTFDQCRSFSGEEFPLKGNSYAVTILLFQPPKL